MLIESKDKTGHISMHSIHQAKLKSGHLLHKMALAQSQRNRTVVRFRENIFSSNFPLVKKVCTYEYISLLHLS